jgi:hypothetical protein
MLASLSLIALLSLATAFGTMVKLNGSITPTTALLYQAKTLRLH